MHKVLFHWRWFAAALAALLVTGGAEARCSFLLDLSGSMAGYHTPGRYQQTYGQLVSSIQDICPDSYGFTVGDPVPLPDPASAPAGTKDTHLDEAFGWWLRRSQPGDTILLLTDNIADDRGGVTSEAQQRFYDQVRSKDTGLAGAEVQGLRLPFNGKVISLVDSNNEIYDGDRALALYLISKKPAGGETLQSFRTIRSKAAQAVAGVLSDPASHHNFTVRPFEEMESRLSTEWIKTKLKVRMKHGDLHDVWSRFDDRTHTILVDRLPRGEPADLEVPLTITPGPDFDIKNVDVSAWFVTPASALSSERRVPAEINRKTIDIKAGKPVEIVIRVPVQPFDWTDQPSLKQRLQRLFWPSQIAKGRIEISYRLDRRNIAINDTVSQDWHTDDRAGLGRARRDVQRRLYLLQQLLQSMATSGVDETGDSLTVPLKPIEARFRLIPSMSDTFKLLLVLLVIGAVAVAAYIYFSGSITFSLSGHTSSRTATLGVVGIWHGTTTPLRAHLIRCGPLIAVWWSGNEALPIPTLFSTNGGTAFAPVRGSNRPSITLHNGKSATSGTSLWGIGRPGGNQGRFKP